MVDAKMAGRQNVEPFHVRTNASIRREDEPKITDGGYDLRVASSISLLACELSSQAFSEHILKITTSANPM